MDNQVPTYCAQKRMDPEDATLVLNGIPFCNDDDCKRRGCFALAEKIVRRGKPREGDFNGA